MGKYFGTDTIAASWHGVEYPKDLEDASLADNWRNNNKDHVTQIQDRVLVSSENIPVLHGSMELIRKEEPLGDWDSGETYRIKIDNPEDRQAVDEFSELMELLENPKSPNVVFAEKVLHHIRTQVNYEIASIDDSKTTKNSTKKAYYTDKGRLNALRYVLDLLDNTGKVLENT